MRQEIPCPEFVEAMDAICQKAKVKNCRIWIDAEQDAVQGGIDEWTIELMRKYNADGYGKALIYNTIQAYLRRSRTKLEEQLKLADKEGWTLAVKLVRGAYIGTDPRKNIHDTKKDTDDSYDGIVRDLLSGVGFGFQGRIPELQLFIGKCSSLTNLS